MVLGLDQVIESNKVELGRFYLRYGYDKKPVLFQCVSVGDQENETTDFKALVYSPGTNRPFSIEQIPDFEPIVALNQVEVRVDAVSISGSSRTSSLYPGMFLVSGTDSFVVAAVGTGYWHPVNISNGRLAPRNLRNGWVSFSRWILVIIDNGEEISIANFGE